MNLGIHVVQVTSSASGQSPVFVLGASLGAHRSAECIVGAAIGARLKSRRGSPGDQCPREEVRFLPSGLAIHLPKFNVSPQVEQ
jgi:hypothetical protein